MSAMVPLAAAAGVAVGRAISNASNRRVRRRAPRGASSSAVRAPGRARGRRRQTRALSSGPSRSNALPPIVRHYINTMNDPFAYSGVRLGWGTMVHTDMNTLYSRGSFNCHTDGSFGLAAFPVTEFAGALAPIMYNNSGAATATWSGVQYNNKATFLSTAYAGRVVSGGIRVFPQVAATAAPGRIYAASLPDCARNAVSAATINGYTDYSYCQIGYGASGCTVVSRPTDTLSFDIRVEVTSGGMAVNTTSTSSIPLVVGTGFPASTPVIFEIVWNFETITNINNTPYMGSVAQIDDEESLADYHSSYDQMYRQLRPLLANPVAIDQGTTSRTSLLPNDRRHYFSMGRSSSNSQRRIVT